MTLPFETSFAEALLDAERPIPGGISAHSSATPTRRFAVYRNNFVAGLVKALKTRFPAIERIVGEECFAALARAFVIERPPRTPLLATYGEEFPDFIVAFEPTRELAYLADVARLENARVSAYHASDAAPAAASRFAALDTDALADIRIEMHPSNGIVRSPHPIVTIWAMNCGELELAPVENWHGEDALVIRPYLDVEVHLLPPGGAAFLLALTARRTLGEAVEAALLDDPKFDHTRNFAGLIHLGLVRDLILPEREKRGLL
jgi:hypothetical protein